MDYQNEIVLEEKETKEKNKRQKAKSNIEYEQMLVDFVKDTFKEVL